MSCGTLVSARRLTFSRKGLLPSLAGLSNPLLLRSSVLFSDPQPRRASPSVWPLSRSLAATWKIDFSFSSSGYLDVSVHRVPFVNLFIQLTMTGVSPAGFPHSDIHGSLVICTSPWLFAAYHVFLRLLVPRHPPYALSYLISPHDSHASSDVST